MGAYSPAPVVSAEVHARVMREVIGRPCADWLPMACPTPDFLYAGLMISPSGAVQVLEFNCRLGDPETQPIMLRLRADLTQLCESALDRGLDRIAPQWDQRCALGVVLAASGYPENVRLGDAIEGLDAAAQLPGKLFHAGTRLEHGRVVTSGGRVLCACGSRAERPARRSARPMH